MLVLTIGSKRPVAVVRASSTGVCCAAIAVLRFSEPNAQKQSNSAQKAHASISSLSSSRMRPVQICSPAFINGQPPLLAQHEQLAGRGVLQG